MDRSNQREHIEGEVASSNISSKGAIKFETKAGHSIVLDDTTGAERVVVKHKGGSDKGGSEITMAADGSVTIKASMNITLAAKGAITLDANNVDVKVKTAMNVS